MTDQDPPPSVEQGEAHNCCMGIGDVPERL